MAKSETMSSIKEAAGTMATKAQASMATDAETFAKHAAMSDLYEIEAANIALRRARRADVQEFARKMIADHTRTTENLKTVLARTHGIELPPHQLDSIHQTMIDDLEGAADESFDDRYISQQESAHSTALTLYRTFADSGDKAELCEFARQTVPALEEHMAMVERLKNAR